ncbi:cation:proton antiporter family protein [Thalassotalea piscium]|uniref:Putative Kef-type K+ transport protein n=1 Tax=Thalassotalea piscium TaxID=1230533 RepID=A0A7X0TVE9_9GAMM|nr:cation:proton antiporter family protein [Thalassotalea piscium]MBB6545040.1 putative Kef-type K+ transport protein [Thalassotalea piscium]
MEFIWIFFAFAFGLISKLISLPPSIGYLVAGFLLFGLGFQADDTIMALSNMGITLMLFSIGLKLNIKDLLKKEVWLSTLSHTALWIIFALIALKLFAIISLAYAINLTTVSAALIVFALSFSSTVCVVKLLEDHGEMRTRHGKLAIAILVMQDVIAVVFLVLATGKTPSHWALLLLLVIPFKKVISQLVDKAGHGELLPLFGFFIAFGAYEVFELVNIKGDLGALLAGVYIASHSKSSEISKSLLSFKDLFLIGFFLSIGFTALPTWEMFGTSLLLLMLLPVKFALFFFILLKLKIRGRTAFLSSLTLSNFSEFGLIVCALSVKEQWLSEEWLIIISLAVALSFVITNICYNYAHSFFSDHKEWFKKYESNTRLPEDDFIQPTDAPIIIIGMGRVGMGAFKALNSHNPNKVWGLDTDKAKVAWLNENDVLAYTGDAEDADFWENINLDGIKLVLLALPSVQDSMCITTQLQRIKYKGKIAAIARFDDEKDELENFGVDKVFNFYTEAGVGFAEESMELINKQAL